MTDLPSDDEENVDTSTPILEIERQQQGLPRIRMAAHLLYEKYIAVGSEFEVNISARLRRRLRDKDAMNWETVHVKGFVHVFDGVVDDMSAVIKNTFP